MGLAKNNVNGAFILVGGEYFTGNFSVSENGVKISYVILFNLH
jgi:hypothetical protein